MQIGSVSVDPNLVLAPMEGVTDRLFRRHIRRVGGCGLTVTEFIPARSLSEAHRRAVRMAEFDPDEHPVSVQIYGREPDVLAEAAKAVADQGADIVDLNMGCPSKKVCNNSGGSALMKEPALAKQIVRAMRAAVEIPFTVKMRAGWDADHLNAPDIARMCETEGADMVAVHWRTRTDGYGGTRSLDTIAQVVDAVSIPVLANGDIVDAESALATLAHTGCAGLMIGRGALRDPWVFRRIERAMAGEPPLEMSVDCEGQPLLAYLEELADLARERGAPRYALGRMKQLAKHVGEVFPDGAQWRDALFQMRDLEMAMRHNRDFFGGRQAA